MTSMAHPATFPREGVPRTASAEVAEGSVGLGLADETLCASSSVPHERPPFLPNMDHEEAGIALSTGTPPAKGSAVNNLVATGPTRPAIAARAIRQAPTRRSSLLSVPRLASLSKYSSTAVSPRTPAGATAGQSRFFTAQPVSGSGRAARKPPAGEVGASKVLASEEAAAKAAVSQAASAKESAAREPFAEALAGLFSTLWAICGLG